MKVHYINILLFALLLNILIYNQRNHKSPTPHTSKIPTKRSLCECELYAPTNYDNDLEMKEAMDNFNKQTQQRFHEYNDRMVEKRKQCKDKCDKEIQKIILKDKLEKEFMDKFTTLHTDIQSDAIPTCICEKSMVDKMEKGCLRCGRVLGGGVPPCVGLLGTVAIGAWKNAAIATATKYATAKGLALGKIFGELMGTGKVLNELEGLGVHLLFPDLFQSIGTEIHFTEDTKIAGIIHTQYKATCFSASSNGPRSAACNRVEISFGIFEADGITRGPPAVSAIPDKVKPIVEVAKEVAAETVKDATEKVTEGVIETKTGIVEATSYNWYSTISYSIIAIEVIVLIMMIIYWILRYRRKKKMKKKLQYIKLLEE
ncbi:rifin [Plasmodium reichenowi]|uniref:Rifin n=1 Tax=Plasmodium reichenowi TaxID=5854 RepID=A0A060RRD3_PLARE|nr:rifin [Plasmodium reichenowi]